MIALSIDPGEVNSGVALLKFDNQEISFLDCRNLVLPQELKKSSFIDIVLFHRQYFKDVLASFPNLDLMVLEGPALAGHHLFNIGALHFSYLQICNEEHISYVHMPISKWKFAWFGTAKNISKGLYMRKAQEFFWGSNIKSSDAAAAALIGYSAIRFFLFHKMLLLKCNLTENEIEIFLGGSRCQHGLVEGNNKFWRFFDERKAKEDVSKRFGWGKG